MSAAIEQALVEACDVVLAQDLDELIDDEVTLSDYWLITRQIAVAYKTEHAS